MAKATTSQYELSRVGDSSLRVKAIMRSIHGKLPRVHFSQIMLGSDGQIFLSIHTPFPPHLNRPLLSYVVSHYHTITFFINQIPVKFMWIFSYTTFKIQYVGYGLKKKKNTWVTISHN